MSSTGHPFVGLSVKMGLAHIDFKSQADHPKYKVENYATAQHDGFPPLIIASVGALSDWGINRRAVQILSYWLSHFVKDNGTFNYYGPSISECGQLLHTAALLEERAGAADWWDDGFQGVIKSL